MKPFLVAANWKMHGRKDMLKTWLEAFSQADIFHQQRGSLDKVGLILCLPAVYIEYARSLIDSLNLTANLRLGVQDVSKFGEDGAYTGEFSAAMLKDIGCESVIIGHSERRQLMGETDEVCADKFQQALAVGLSPIYCVGETLEERESGNDWAVISRQLSAIEGGTGFGDGLFSIAYEPVWAIGTGRNATPKQAQAMHVRIRAFLAEKLGQEKSSRVPILYGGSVKPDNAEQLFAENAVKGGLIGGASLKVAPFLDIVSALVKAKSEVA